MAAIDEQDLNLGDPKDLDELMADEPDQVDAEEFIITEVTTITRTTTTQEPA